MSDSSIDILSRNLVAFSSNFRVMLMISSKSFKIPALSTFAIKTIVFFSPLSNACPFIAPFPLLPHKVFVEFFLDSVIMIYDCVDFVNNIFIFFSTQSFFCVILVLRKEDHDFE